MHLLRAAPVALPGYLLAMKCIAMRLGEEFHDLDDVRYLLRYLNLSTPEEAVAVVRRYFDEKHLPAKTRLVLGELLPQKSSPGTERRPQNDA